MKNIIRGIGIYVTIAGTGIVVKGVQGREVFVPGLSYGDIQTSGFTTREGPDGELIWLGIFMVSIGLAAIILPSIRQGLRQLSGQGLLSRGGAFICWILGAIGLQLSVKVFDGIWGVLSAGTGFSLIGLGARLFAEAKRVESPSATKAIGADERPVILYLRSFREDARESSSNSMNSSNMLSAEYWTKRPWAFEELVCSGLQELGTVVALGRPDKLAPPLGAYRDYVPTEEWMNHFIELAAKSDIVCITIGNTPGLLWELEHVVATKEPSRVVLLVPQPPPFDFAETWKRFAEDSAERVLLQLPIELPKGVIAVQFVEGWNPKLVLGKPAGFEYRRIVGRIVNTIYDSQLSQQVTVDHATANPAPPADALRPR